MQSWKAVVIYWSLAIGVSTALICDTVFSALPTTISGIDLRSSKKKSVSLTESKLGTVVVFLSSICPCSNSHLPVLEQLSREYAKEGFIFVGVHSNANEEFSYSLEYFQKAKLPFPVIQDEEAIIADQFNAFKTPHVFVLSPKLKILFQGGVDDSKVMQKAKKHYLKEALMAIQNGKEPVEKDVRVLGCEIKRP